MSDKPLFDLGPKVNPLYLELSRKTDSHWGAGVPTLTSIDWRSGYQRAMLDLLELEQKK